MGPIKIFFLLIFNITVFAYSSESLNNFFSSNLSFVQTTINSIDNSFNKSYGKFYRYSDNSIMVEVNKPFRETYKISKKGVEIHDLDFNQKRFITNEDISNLLLNYINTGFPKNLSNIEIINNSSFKIMVSEKIYHFEFTDKRTLQIKYKDNMNLDTLINFTKNNVN